MNLPKIYTDKCSLELALTSFTVSGADSFEFLQGQSTNRLDDHLRFHAFTDRLGKVLCHFWAFTRPGGFIELICSKEQILDIKEKFEKFVISEDVVLSEPKDTAVCLVFNDYEVDHQPSGEFGGVKVHLNSENNSSHPKVSFEEYRNWCKWQGVPLLTDLSFKGQVINQTLLLRYAVDFKKGCFPGQEVVAKIQNLKGAAWAPVLVELLDPNFCPESVELENKIVVTLDTQTRENNWICGMALRDVRVHHLVLKDKFKIHLYPRFPETTSSRALELYHLGAELFQNEKEAEALDKWRLAIQVDPMCADAYEAIGVLLGRQEKFQEAEGWMRKLLEVDPDSVMAHTNLSLFLMRQDKIKEAEDHKALATVASFKSFGKQAAEKKALEKQESERIAELDKRQSMFMQVLEIDPDDPMALHGLGAIMLEKGEFALARGYLEKVIKIDPKYSVAYLALGKCYVQLKEIEIAKNILASGIKIAAQKGDLMPANEMQTVLLGLK